jgi:adenylosuccinate synthase
MVEMHVIVDLQFGSCGKGLLAGHLAESVVKPDTLITAWAPNAGHTYINAAGDKFVNIALPNGIVSPNLKRILIGPGSVINPELLMSEMERYEPWLDGVEILIHEHAAVVMEKHRAHESEYAYKIGSTMKGVGAAVIEKIARDPDSMIVARDVLRGTPLEGLLVSTEHYNNAFDLSRRVLVEGAQGFSLGINNGFYPYTTSRECTVQQIMSDCAIPIWPARAGWRSHVKVWGACRTFPIRVANRFKDGVQVGWSGPNYWDQNEINWGDIGLEPELTTVTRLPRRVFTFSMEQIKQAVRMNGCDAIFMNFANYLGRDAAYSLVSKIEHAAQCKVEYIGWGPASTDIEKRMDPEESMGRVDNEE